VALFIAEAKVLRSGGGLDGEEGECGGEEGFPD